MVECDLAKVEVAGSNPVSRSRKTALCPSQRRGFCVWPIGWPVVSDAVEYDQSQVRRGTQVVRERSAKPLCVGSIPTRASKSFRRILDQF